LFYQVSFFNLFFDLRLRYSVPLEHCFKLLPSEAFATHLLEDGTDIVRIQKLLGHANIRTTLLYLHVAKVKLLQVKSPLDSLLEEEHHES
jgi:integrase